MGGARRDVSMVMAHNSTPAGILANDAGGVHITGAACIITMTA